jgi:hypothetical protein
MKPHLCIAVIACAIFVCTGFASADPVQKSIGIAEMQKDGSIDLYLKTDPGQLQIDSGSVGSLRMISKPGDSDYQKWIRQVGGLKVGERKLIPPLGDDFSQPTSSDSKKSTLKTAKPAKPSKAH